VMWSFIVLQNQILLYAVEYVFYSSSSWLPECDELEHRSWIPGVWTMMTSWKYLKFVI